MSGMVPVHYQIRPATVDDAEWISRYLLANRFRTVNGQQKGHFRKPNQGDLNQKYIEQCIQNGEGEIFFVAEEGDKLVGCVSVVIYRKSPEVEIGRLYVKPNSRGQGYATALVRVATTHAIEKLGSDEVRGYVERDNKAARSAYENSGYIFIEGMSLEKVREHCFTCPKYGSECQQETFVYTNGRRPEDPIPLREILGPNSLP